MTRIATATTLSLMLMATPFALIVALVVSLAAGLGGWWSVGIVAIGYGHTLVSSRLDGFISDAFAAAPKFDPASNDNPPSALTPSQRTVLQSADPRIVPQGQWLQFTFPTILLGLAVAGTVLSLRTAIMLLMGFTMFTVAWLITSAMLMWPLHRQIDLERGMSHRQRLVRQIAVWSIYALFWLLAVGALIMWIGSSPTFAVVWGAGLVLGAGLALWKRPLVWQTAADESTTPASQSR